MAVSTDYIIRLKDRFSAQLKGAQTQADKLNGKVSRINKGFSGLGSTLARIGAVTALGFAAKKVGELGIEMEQTRVAFATFLGDGEKANKLIAQLNEFANVTPFNNAEIIKSGRLLLAAGIPAEGITDQLKQIGDVAAGANVPITELAAIFQKATNKGKLQAEELNQFSERGIPLLDQLSKQFGVTKEEVLELGSQGKISAAVMNQAFTDMTSEGGIFFNLMEKQSKTVGGRISTLVGQLQTIGIGIGEAALPLIGRVVDGFQTFINFVKTNFENLKQIFAPFGEFFKPIINALTEIGAKFGLLNSEGSVLESVFNAIGNVLVFLAPVFKFFGTAIGEIITIVGEVIAVFVDWISKTEMAQKVLAGIIGGIIGIYKNLASAIVSIFKGVGNLLIGVLTLDLDKIKQGLSGVAEAFLRSNPIAAGAAAAAGFAKGFKGGFQDKKDFFPGQEEAKDAAKKSSLTGSLPGGAGGITPTTGKGALKAGISEVKAGAPKTFNINIEKLVEGLNINTTNLTDSAAKIQAEVQKALLLAVTDTSIISE